MEVRGNQTMSKTSEGSRGQRPKTSKLAIASLVCIAISIACGIVFSAAERARIEPLSVFSGLLGFACLLATLVLGLLALGKIKDSYGLLAGKGLAITAMVVSCGILSLGFIMPHCGRSTPRVRRMVCGANMKGIGFAIQNYAQDNGGKYPTVSEWCDLLIQHPGVRPRSFACAGSSSRLGESSYAINKNLVGKKVSDVGGDVVLLFETNFGKTPAGRNAFLRNRKSYKSGDEPGYRDDRRFGGPADNSKKVYELRWNQSGGAEILTTDNHKGEGCNVLFNDLSVRFVKTENIRDLKW
jgi:hypothetical protein